MTKSERRRIHYDRHVKQLFAKEEEKKNTKFKM